MNRNPSLQASHSMLLRILLCLALPHTLLAQTPDPNLARGISLFGQGQFQAALDAFETVARTHPDNPRLENLLGLANSKLDRLDEANVHYRRAIALDTNFAAPHKNLGFNLLNRGDHQSAEKELKTALALDPHDPFTHYYLGLLYLATANDKGAVEELNRAPELVANDPQTTFRLAVLLSEKGHPREALAQFQKLAQTDPASVANQFNVAVAFLNLHQPQNALEVLTRLAAAHPDDPAILDLLGLAREDNRQFSEALAAYRRAVAANPRNPDPYLDYTRLLIKQSRFEEATAFLQPALTAVADPYSLYLRLGAIDLLNGKTADARNWFERATRLHPDLALGYVALARSYLKDNANQDAARVLQSGSSRCPRDYMLEYTYALTLERLAQTPEAIRAFEAAIPLNPAAAAPHNELGKLYLAEGKLDAALRELQRALAIDPYDADACYQLSRLYLKLGDTQKAHELALRTKTLKSNELEQALISDAPRATPFQTTR